MLIKDLSSCFFVFLLSNDLYFEHTQRYKIDNQRTRSLDTQKLLKTNWISEKKCYYLMKHQQKKDLLLLATKLIEKIPDASNAK